MARDWPETKLTRPGYRDPRVEPDRPEEEDLARNSGPPTEREKAMKAVVERCAGIDVAKKVLNVCVMTGAANVEPTVELRLFGVSTRS